MVPGRVEEARTQAYIALFWDPSYLRALDRIVGAFKASDGNTDVEVKAWRALQKKETLYTQALGAPCLALLTNGVLGDPFLYAVMEQRRARTMLEGLHDAGNASGSLKASLVPLDYKGKCGQWLLCQLTVKRPDGAPKKVKSLHLALADADHGDRVDHMGVSTLVAQQFVIARVPLVLATLREQFGLRVPLYLGQVTIFTTACYPICICITPEGPPPTRR